MVVSIPYYFDIPFFQYLMALGCEAVPSHEDYVGVKEETAIVDAAAVPGMELVSTGGKENIEQVTVVVRISHDLLFTAWIHV